MRADVYLLEADAGNVTEGLGAELVIDAHPDTPFAAKVSHVDTLAQPRHPKVPVNYFGVQLSLDRTDTELMRIGQRVRATIFVELPDALVIPRQAVSDRDGQTVVYRRSGDAFEAVPVTLGQASAGRVTIVSGLEPGDVIALRDPTRDSATLLADGDGDGDGKHGKPKANAKDGAQ